MDPGEACPGPNGDITQYQISFQTGSFETVNTARCTAGRCSFAFRPPLNPPSSYDNVSVAAENVVGVGAAQKCTTQTISELYLSTLCLFFCSAVTCTTDLFLRTCTIVGQNTVGNNISIMAEARRLGLDQKF